MICRSSECSLEFAGSGGVGDLVAIDDRVRAVEADLDGVGADVVDVVALDPQAVEVVERADAVAGVAGVVRAGPPDVVVADRDVVAAGGDVQQHVEDAVRRRAPDPGMLDRDLVRVLDDRRLEAGPDRDPRRALQAELADRPGGVRADVPRLAALQVAEVDVADRGPHAHVLAGAHGGAHLPGVGRRHRSGDARRPAERREREDRGRPEPRVPARRRPERDPRSATRPAGPGSSSCAGSAGRSGWSRSDGSA